MLQLQANKQKSSNPLHRIEVQSYILASDKSSLSVSDRLDCVPINWNNLSKIKTKHPNFHTLLYEHLTCRLSKQNRFKNMLHLARLQIIIWTMILNILLFPFRLDCYHEMVGVTPNSDIRDGRSALPSDAPKRGASKKISKFCLKFSLVRREFKIQGS